MRVLHLSETPLSGAPYRLMQVQRQSGIDARLISHRDNYDGRSKMKFSSDIVLQTGDNEKNRHNLNLVKEEIHELFKNADIIHFHNFLFDQYVFKLFPELESIARKKPLFYQVHSPRTSLKNIHRIEKDTRIACKLVIAQYQVRFYPGYEVVPNAVPIFDELHSPIARKNDIPIISYSPSNVCLKDWNNKGYPETMSAMREVTLPHKLDVYTDIPHDKCLLLRQKSDITIDEVMTGSYHMVSLEGLSQGHAVINNIDDKCLDALSRITGTLEHPFIKAGPKTLKSVVEDLLHNPHFLKLVQYKSRKFMEDHWSPEKVTFHYRRLYERF